MHRGRKQWEPHVEEQLHGCPGASCYRDEMTPFLQCQITSWLLGLAAGFSGCYSNGAGLWVPTDAHRCL